MASYYASLDQQLWEFATQDDAKGVRAALKAGARFSYLPRWGGRGDALMEAIYCGSESVIQILLRAHPMPSSSVLVAAIGNTGLSDLAVLKVVKHPSQRLDEKEKGQLPLHAAMLRKTPAVAEFLLSKKIVMRGAGAAYKGLNALELLLSRQEALDKSWEPVVKTLMELGLKVRPKTQIDKRNQKLLGKQVAEKQAKALDKATPQATAPNRRRTI